MKPSEIFEGPNSSLRKTYEEAIEPKEWEERFHRLFPFADAGRECCMELTEMHDITFKSFISTLLQEESSKMAAAIEMSKQGWIEGERERILELIEGERKYEGTRKMPSGTGIAVNSALDTIKKRIEEI